MYIDYRKTKDEIVKWIREWFEKNGPGCNAVIGMSGGKDSTIVAALLVEALGSDRVIGVMIPSSNQRLNGADDICRYLGIRSMVVNLGEIENMFRGAIVGSLNVSSVKLLDKLSEQSETNIMPRLRMTTLYAISQTVNGRVIGTCNASENYLGYFTRWGDGVSDMEPIGGFTVDQVKTIGYELGLPREWVDKTPDDGLVNSSPDEEKFGFTYATLDRYLMTGECDDEETLRKIKSMHEKNAFKMHHPSMFILNEDCYSNPVN